MKKIIIALVALMVLACNNENETKPDFAVVSGKILNTTGEVSINSFDRSFSQPVEIAADGTFTDTLSTDKNYYVLYDGKNPVLLYLEPGFNINISYSANDFKNTLKYTGEGAAQNDYFFSKQENEARLLGNRFDAYLLDEAEFKTKFKALKASNDSLLNTFKDLPDTFVAKAKKDLDYSYLARVNEYERYHQYVTNSPDFKVSEGFLKELDGLDLSNESDYFFSNDYKNLVVSKYQKDAEALALTDTIADDLAYIKSVTSIENQNIKNDLLFDFANNNLSYSKDIDVFYKLYADNSTNEANNTIVKEKFDKLKALAKGSPSPKFTNYRNHDGSTTSLEDLLGKYVYIDVWATWCGPCIREIPALKEVEHNYGDKNIQFVSVSIDKEKDFDTWTTMVTDKSLGGVQLFADNDWNSKFVKDYEIQGIPRFILIDPNGNIVSANAPRPSDPALIDMFKALDI